MKDRIRQLMDAMHMNQQTFASSTGIGSASLSNIFNGRTQPTLKQVDAITDKFPNVNPWWLLKGQGRMFLTTDEMNTATGRDATLPSSGNNESATQERQADLFSSANLSVNQNSFTEQPAVISIPVPTQSQVRGQQPSFQTTPPRKITEIRLFYDDQTWETFVPKNK